MMVQRERNVRLTRGDFNDINEAMSWAVRMFDAELKGASMVKLEIGQIEMLTAGTGEAWATEWTASVSGVITEADRDPWAG
jgi:hypothetical protein